MNNNNTSGRSYKNLTMGKKQLKKVRKLKPSSQKWVLRQLNDPFVKQAKMKGYRSRAAIKLEQMDNKYCFLIIIIVGPFDFPPAPFCQTVKLESLFLYGHHFYTTK